MHDGARAFGPCTLSTRTLSTRTLSTRTLSTRTLSTYTLSTYTLSTYTLSTYTLSIDDKGVHPMTGLPLLVVGHGTRSDSGVAEFNAFMDRLKCRREAPYRAAAGGFIELSRPPVTEAVASLVGQGHRELVALPLVLVSAGHGKGDIPAALLREQERHPGMSYSYGRPLGPHPALLEILERRIEAVLGDTGRKDTHVLLVGRGSTDPDANAEIAKVARLLWEGRGYAGVEPAFVSLADPGVPAGLERLRRLGAERIVVAPYFLFPGVLPDRIVSQSSAFAIEHPDLAIGVAGVIGDCDELADLVIERYYEVVGGDIRMNCDTCIYRSTMTGFDDRVGQPQRPHHHPDDASHAHDGHAHDGHAHDGHAHELTTRTITAMAT